MSSSEDGHRIAAAERADGSLTASLGEVRFRRFATTVAWLAFAAFVFFSLGTSLVGSHAFLASDALTARAPWTVAHEGPDPVNNPYLGDTIDTVAPSSIMLSESIRDGDLAFWNPYSAGGSALGTSPDYAMYSPLSVPWLVLPTALAPVGVKVLELATIAVGCVLLARRFRMHAAAGPLMALAYSASGFMVVWTNWPQTRVGAVLPILLWAVDRLVERRRVRDAVPLALALYAGLSGGFPAVLLAAIYFIVAWAIVRLITLRVGIVAWLRTIGIGALGGVIGAGLAAFQLVPWVMNARQAIDFEARNFAGDHLDVTALATAFAPDIFGIPNESFVGIGHPVEVTTAIGGAALGLIAIAVLRKPRQIPKGLMWFSFASAIVICIALFLGGPVLDLLQTLPGMKSSFFGRTRAVLGLATTVLLGIGVTALFVRRDDRSLRSTASRVDAALRTTVLVLAGASVAFAVVRAIQIVPPDHGGSAKSAAVIAGLAALVTILLGLASSWRSWRSAQIVAAIAIPSILAAQGASFANTWWTKSELETVYPETATHRFLESNLGSERFTGIDATMWNGTTTAYALRSVTGHSFHQPGWRALLEAADPSVMASPTYSQLHAEALTSPILDRLAARYAVVNPQQAIPSTLEAFGPRASIVEVGAGERASSPELAGPARGVRILSASPTGAAFEVAAIGDDGAVLASTHTEPPANADPAETWVALDIDDLDADTKYRIVIENSGDEPIVVSGDRDELAVDLARPIDDGLSVAATGDATIYQRGHALERFRWSNEAVVEPSESERLLMLASGELADTTVVLDEAAADFHADADSAAAISVVEDSSNRIELRVSSDGAGYLTVADALQHSGWSATVDGAPAQLLDADEGLVAVAVEAGDHDVVLSYTAPGLSTGIIGSVAAAIAFVALLLFARQELRRDRARELPARTRERPSGTAVSRAQEESPDPESPS